MFELIWHREGRTKTKTEKHSSAFLRARRIWGDGVYFALFCLRMLIGSYTSLLILVFILLTCLLARQTGNWKVSNRTVRSNTYQRALVFVSRRPPPLQSDHSRYPPSMPRFVEWVSYWYWYAYNTRKMVVLPFSEVRFNETRIFGYCPLSGNERDSTYKGR
jgi:hypothetical protein